MTRRRPPRFDRLDDRIPHVRFLSNGAFTVAVSGAGGGYASRNGQAVTNFVPDRTQDGLGYFIYLRDLDEKTVWSATYQPTCVAGDSRRAIASSGVVEFDCSAHQIDSKLEICVDPERDCEVRRLTITDRAGRERRIEVTSYAELVLAPLAVQHGHPAFAKLFVQTQYADETLLASRRPRGRGEKRTWAAHRLVGDGALEWETDRVRFVGRGRTLSAPLALSTTSPLSGTTGNVLDPIFALRRVVQLPAGGSARFDFLLTFGETREQAVAALAADRQAIDHAFAAAAERERSLRKRQKLRGGETEALHESAGHALYRVGERVDPATAAISPAAKAYLAAVGVDAVALETAAPQTPRETQKRARSRRRHRTRLPDVEPAATTAAPLLRDNGYGGFAPDGREYVIQIDGANARGALPPTPWINVIANERFGFLVSETGAGYTWSENSRENRLTPWSNDPVSDPHGEAIYVRDERSHEYWSALPGPIAGATRFEVRHGFGSTTWRHETAELAHEVTAFVPRDASVKIVTVRLENRRARRRKISLFAYHQLVLGVLGWETAPSITTEIEAGSGTIFARNVRSTDFANRLAFAAAATPDGATVHATADRTSFLGRNGAPDRPAALAAPALDGACGAGLDPCAALQVTVEIGPNGTVECSFLLGEEASRDAAARTIARFRAPGAIAAAAADVRAFWRGIVGAVEVETPSEAIDLMLNGWLLYQCVSCRLWGRSAFYQSGGAWGFRDQLQDSAALVYTRPELARAQILLHAAHQFVEGDVLHWWHPPADRGTRTRCSDDLLWLPYITSFYVATTGDWSVLEERAGYVTARALEPGEDETYLQASPAAESSDVYEHCCRAIDRSLGLGAHGLPFMGTCDWNDGMNHVGREGRGESVWLGFFLYELLADFLPACERRGDTSRAERYRAHRDELRHALETAGWDGGWYRRAYDDDGLPWGSAENEECKIDVLAQAWAVISKAASPERASQAMDAVERMLVDPRGKLIRLLTPPFDETTRDPGYIKGYVPGIRENGGQYTHGATWAIRAFAELGRRDRAARYLEMITPVAHASDRASTDVYKVEPYVVVADIYGSEPHVGRGGWTWYTGSAGWLYRVALESVLGITLHDGRELRVKPRVPDDWPRFRVCYRLRDSKTLYEIEIVNPDARAESVRGVTIDGAGGTVEGGAARIPITADGASHRVTVTLG